LEPRRKRRKMTAKSFGERFILALVEEWRRKTRVDAGETDETPSPSL
jgi:hypothetical protein